MPALSMATADREPRTVDEYVACKACDGLGQVSNTQATATMSTCPACRGVGSRWARSLVVRP